MYRIIAYESPTDTTGRVVYDPRISKQLSDGKLDLKEAEIDSLELTVNQENWLFGHVKPLQTHIEVYQDETLLFRGRAFDISRQMKDSGQFIQSFNFESVQNYLQDTSQRWAKIQNTTPKQFFQRLIDTHNSQVPDYKKFQVRSVTVTNSTDNVYRYIEDGATTWDTIKDKLISRLGGYIVVEHQDSANYIDYLQDVGVDHSKDTPIQLAKNLQSASVVINPTEVITQLVPLGATIQDDNANADSDTAVSQPRIDIKTVNNGKDYIDIPALQAEFGVIRKSVQWEDVHEPTILLSKASQWIAKQTSAKESWSVNAIELPQFNSFKVSDRYVFSAEQVATRQLLRVTAKTIDFANWQKSSLTFAEKQMPLSQYQLENKKAAQQISRLNAKISGYDTQIFNLNTEQKELNNTISEQQTLIATIQKDVENADLQGVANKLENLSDSVDDLGTQISNLDFVTSQDFGTFQTGQLTINRDFESRIRELEDKETGTDNG